MIEQMTLRLSTCSTSFHTFMSSHDDESYEKKFKPEGWFVKFLWEDPIYKEIKILLEREVSDAKREAFKTNQSIPLDAIPQHFRQQRQNKPCEHEPWVSIRLPNIIMENADSLMTRPDFFYCKKCNTKIRATGWEEL